MASGLGGSPCQTAGSRCPDRPLRTTWTAGATGHSRRGRATMPDSTRPMRWMRAAVVSLAVAGAVTLMPNVAEAATTLGAAAAQSGRYFGAAVAAGRLGDAQYTTILDREFNMVTPENEMKWDATERSRNSFSFGPADQIVNRARGRGQRLRGHTLVWHSQLPSWVSAIGDANTLRGVMNNHITTLMSRYRGQIYAWDVVNEAFADGGSGQLRSSVFRNVLGTGFLEEAFRTARTVDPAARLCYNDYSIEDWTAAKTQGVFRLVQDFRSRGVPIDCVGFQAHFGSGGPPSTFQTTLSNFAALGVDVQITELDIAQAPAAAYTNTVQACVRVARCSGITAWGIRDNDSWRSGENPLPFDRGGNRKPAYDAILAVLNATATPPPATRVVSLRAHANNNLVSAANAGAGALIANRTSIGAWEQFDLITNADGSVSFRSHANNNLVTAENAGASALIANRTAIGPWEEFDLIRNANGSVSFRSHANNNLVTADNGGASPLIANRTTIGQWEEFDLIG
ncbi:MAG TPA: endo-1,4-beta-xylanase [Actinophytocola sp.]|uniref:endo-1,4-beta-xylanase n=1 Tax=Actinophytocola sp. TaxID=1872138 RepID=UPI002DBF56C3|nr:endo-1,4-beta-xylanase [Actinophytocola sp.]HEU5473678.1 endo-1,4-beta-xylanase [Actinophytocola sp.]